MLDFLQTVPPNTSSIKPPKSKAGTRKVPIPEILLPYLQGEHASDEVFCQMVSGGYMTQIGYNRAWNSYLHYLNLQAGGRDRSRSHPKVQAASLSKVRGSIAALQKENSLAGLIVMSPSIMSNVPMEQYTTKLRTHLKKPIK